MSGKKVMLAILVVLVVGFIILQLLPAPGRTNPPIISQVHWNSLETEALVRRACYDCRSNETVWPWYAQFAPVSWLVGRDVNQGRRAMNFSEGIAGIDGGELIDDIERGKMPPGIYLLMHPEVNLSDAEKAQLIEGIRATLGGR